MLITIPAAAHGPAQTTSVLDLEPLIGYVRQCRPDAVSLMPPIGADDLPNGAALLAIRERLRAEGIRIVAQSFEVAVQAPVADPAWQAETLFGARALLAALGEADVGPLRIAWGPDVRDPAGRAPLLCFMESLLDEAGRAEVPVALSCAVSPKRLDPVLRALDSPYLGVCYTLAAGGRRRTSEEIHHLGAKLLSVRASGTAAGHRPGTAADGADPWPSALQTLRVIGFSGPILIEDLETPVEYAHAVGFLRGALAATAGTLTVAGR